MVKGVRTLKNSRRARLFKGFFEEKLQRKLTFKELDYIRWLSELEQRKMNEKNKDNNSK